jgi:tetratricopeptide (TPR) repeat protein
MLSDYLSRNPQFMMAEMLIEWAEKLMRRGRPSDARKILEGALAEQERLQRRHPDHPAPQRNAGQLLTVLARPEEAERAFLEAIEIDRARLDRANDVASKAWVHFSLGETLLAMGDSEAASIELALARSLAPDRRTRWQMGLIGRWWEKEKKVAR